MSSLSNYKIRIIPIVIMSVLYKNSKKNAFPKKRNFFQKYEANTNLYFNRNTVNVYLLMCIA